MAVFDFLKPNVDRLADKKNVKGLINALNFKQDSTIRMKAAAALGAMKEDAALDPLLEALKDVSMEVRAASAEALGNTGDERIIVPLLLAIKNHDYIKPDQKKVREAAIEALGRITAVSLSSSEDIAKILKELDYTYDARKAAALLLGKAGDDVSINILIGLLRDSAADIRITATQILGERGDRKAAIELACMLVQEKLPAELEKAIIQSLGKLKNPAALPQLIKTARYGRVNLKEIIDAFVQIGDPGAVETLFTLMEDSDEEIRTKAGNALAALVPLAEKSVQARFSIRKKDWKGAASLGSDAAAPLINALKSSAVEDRREIIKVLGDIGDGSAAEPLFAHVKDADQEVRDAALQSLGKIIHLSSPDMKARHAVLTKNWELAATFGAAAVEPLLQALREDSECREAEEALKKTGALSDREVHRRYLVAKGSWNEVIAEGPSAFEALFEAVRKGFHYESALEAMKQIAGDSLDLLTPAFEKDGTVKAAAARVLAMIGSTAALEKLIEVTKKEYHLSAKKAMVEALGGLGSASSIEALADILMRDSHYSAGKDEISEVRTAAAKALGKIEDSRALDALVYVLLDTRQPGEIRKAIIRVMGSMNNPDVLEPLQTVYDEYNHSISSEASTALYAFRQHPDAAIQAQYAVMKKDWPLVLSLGNSSLRALKKALRHKDGQVRYEAAQALEKIAVPQEPEEYAWYLMAMRDLKALISLGTHAALPLFHAYECPKNGIPREESAREIGTLGDKRGIPFLTRVISYTDDALDYAPAFNALKTLGSPAIEALIELLKHGKKIVRQKAALALGDLYRKGLDEKDRLLILSVKGEMEKPHSDGSWSSDCAGHSDKGIGVFL
ncbi:MAG: HEAT repeat domain-containing protein [Candidatus Xenobiia bacterium LiM19]